MPYENESEQRRTLGPAIVSALVGALLGAAAIFGLTHVASQSELPAANAIQPDDALLGGPEYGTR